MQSSTLHFAVTVIGPVLMLLLMGNILLRVRLINHEFVATASKLVFTVALPALLFISISQADFSQAANPLLIITGLIGTFGYFVLLMLVSHYLVKKRDAKGVVTQGGFRANMGIIGLAYCAQTYGNAGLAAASVYLGLVTILFNVLSVFVLNFYQDGKRSLTSQLTSIAKNPLIIAILLALPFSYFNWTLPAIVSATGGYFAQLTLPLALLCTGASLQFRSFSADWFNIGLSSVSKCVVYPAVMVGLAYMAGLRGMPLGIVLLMTIAPTAAASYVMVRTLGGDHRLAASIIAVTTLLSLPFTILAFDWLSALRLL
ncbi:AEC family transporter [Alteromonas gilva]|uniref:AEC family transporter n=1 Tax=Alteromonas gilva TaxID=2987522 RepID=A0ABT5L7K6_9ALTE|nr:AEC family transporter [Alteromonas gilva]MDC8832404.1 AEC family transporter [Alteromonas gilva]